MAKIWVMVGDDSRARLFLTNRASALGEVADELNPAGRERAHDLESDRRGLTAERVGRGVSTAGEGDPAAVEARRFARRVAERLREARLAGEYERLFLVAPPAFLGELRRALDGGTRAAVVGELAKDLSRLSPKDIRAHLPALL